MASTIPPSSSSATTPDAAPTATNAQKNFSCVLCAQRKVKCDKRSTGCANCAKASVPCIYKAPPPPRRRKKGMRDIDIHAKMRLYEDALRELGVDPAQLVAKPDTLKSKVGGATADGDADQAIASSAFDNAIPAGPKKTANGNTAKEAGVLISGDGKSRYLENGLWTSLQSEFRDSKHLLDESSEEEVAEDGFSPLPEPFPPDGGNLLFGSPKSAASLRLLHPQPVQIFKFWQAYLDNVNPLIKVLHTPTVQQILLNASGNLDDIPKNVEALLFSIYCVALGSIGDAECNAIMGEPKSIIVQRFRAGAQQALINTSFLKTSDLMVLQAFVLYLISLQSYDARIIWVLAGVAGRIGQRIGLHRDGERLNLPPFDIEMRRRLWWSILFIEGSAEKLAGTGGNLFMGDTIPPSNFNDSDLFQGMKEMPKEHDGATEMMFFKMRTDVGQFLKRFSGAKSNFDGVWNKLTTASVALSVKDKAIDELNELLQTKYLRYCDRSIPWHFMCIHLAKGVICMLRFMAHNAELNADHAVNVSQSEMDMMFDISLQVVEMQNMGYCTKEMQGFLWHVNLNFQWKAFIYLLSQLRYRTQAPIADTAWKQVGMVYQFHPDLASTACKRALHIAIGNLTLKAWDAFVAMRGVPDEGEPYFIQVLRNQRSKPKTSKFSSQESTPSIRQMPTPSSIEVNTDSTANNILQTPLQSWEWTSDLATSLDPAPLISDIPVLDPDQMNWSAWDDLVVDFQVNDPALVIDSNDYFGLG